MAALLSIFAVVVLFWAVFKQNGSALNNWADRYTDREVSGVPGKIFKGLILADTLSYSKRDVPVYDEQFRIQKQDSKVIREENYPYYFHNVKEDQRPVDGNATTLWAPT